MKRRLMPLLAAVVTGCLLFAACGAPGAEANTVKLAVPDGSTAVAVASLMQNGFQSGEKALTFEIVDGTKVQDVIRGEQADLCVAPANLAANLYNKGADYRFAGVVVHSNLFIVGSAPLENGIAGLSGKRIASIGQTAVPSITLRYLLGESGLPFVETVDRGEAEKGKVSIRYAQNGTDAIKYLSLGEVDYALLAEPAVTQAMGKLGAVIALNLQTEWGKIEGNSASGFPQAVIVVRGKFYEKDPEFVRAFLEKVAANPTWLGANREQIGEALGKAESSFSGLTYSEEMLTRLNATYSGGDAGKEEMRAYLGFLNTLNPQLIGGKLPGEAFYL